MFKKEIKWLEDYNEFLEKQKKNLDKNIDDYKTKLKEINYNIRENNKLIQKYQKAQKNT